MGCPHFLAKANLIFNWASHVTLVVKNLPAGAGDAGSIPGLERSPGGGHDNPLQYSCLENPMDRGAWRAKSIGSQKTRARLSGTTKAT